MAEFPAFPVWTDALLADCEHLTDAEFGVYHRLLYYMWRAPAGKLPNDDVWLARKFRRTVEQVGMTVRPLVQEFCVIDGNWIIQKRLQQEYSRAQNQRRKASDLAKSRWENKNDQAPRNAGVDERSIADDSGGSIAPSSPSPSPSPSPSHHSSAPSERDARANGAPNGQSRPRGSRLPNDWQPDERDCAFARELGLEPSSVADAFRDYWHSTTGGKATKADWHATWRLWCRRDVERRTQSNGRPVGQRPSPGGVVGAAAAVIARRQGNA